MRLILARHGATDYNRTRRFRTLQAALSPEGRQQAQALARRLAAEPIAALYASPLSRSLETARPIAALLGLEIRQEHGLRDLDYGAWAGLSTEEARANDAALYRTWLEQPHLAVFPGGEGLPAVRSRVLGALEEVHRRHAQQTVAFVTHDAVCRILICHALGLDDSHHWQLRQDTGAISVIEYGDRDPVILAINDACHLQEEASP